MCTLKSVITLHCGSLSHGNGRLNRKDNKRRGVYKATTYVLKGGGAQPACQNDKSDTTTIPQRGAHLPASGSPVLFSWARPCSCIHATNFGVVFQQSIALYKGQSPACVPPSCRVRPRRWYHTSRPYGQPASFALPLSPCCRISQSAPPRRLPHTSR